ncbi:ABC transporter permease [Defluviimonas sp. SAOS-178_SWC]|uniref:ABC transporter permease n=1 Tax=Defluviimonas sp. SAOS-178_SWC TaxID=3121287 RepID=UPI003221F710
MPSSDPFSPPAQPAGVPPAMIPQRIRTRSFASFRTIFALILREMSTRYGQSPGGYVWAILEPLGGVLMLAFGFSLLIHHPALGTSFMLFYATGFLPFSLYQSILNAVSRALSFSKPLLMYPAVTWMDALIARAVLNTLTGVMVAYLLLTGIFFFSDTKSVLDFGPILLAISMASLFGISVGSFNCFLIGVFPAWELIWSILSRPLFLMSGILFIYEDLPRLLQDILWYNPLLHVVGEMRRGFYPMYSADYVSAPYVILLSLLLLAFSFVMLQRYHRDILNEN